MRKNFPTNPRAVQRPWGRRVLDGLKQQQKHLHGCYMAKEKESNGKSGQVGAMTRGNRFL